MTVTVLVADDHPLIREGLCAVLADDAGLSVVGEASTGEDAVQLASKLLPDVIVMDLRMPGMGGVDATRQILAEQPDTAVLVLTMFEDDVSLFAAMRAGARGYLLKDSPPVVLVRTIKAVADGQSVFGGAVASRIGVHFVGGSATNRPFPELTEREREVLELMAEGHPNAFIARHLLISQKTVRNHVSNVLTKLQVTDRSGAIVRAREAGVAESHHGRG